MYSQPFAIQQRAQNAYNNRSSRGMFVRLLNIVLHKPNELLSYEEVAEHLHITGRHDAGIHVVDVNQIVGSVGRTHDFDRKFHPKYNNSRDRWVSVADAIFSGKELPPIDLYKIHDVYFVIDGNHRISVLRENGQTYVEAHVIEVSTDECIDIVSGEPIICHCEN